MLNPQGSEQELSNVFERLVTVRSQLFRHDQIEKSLKDIMAVVEANSKVYAEMVVEDKIDFLWRLLKVSSTPHSTKYLEQIYTHPLFQSVLHDAEAWPQLLRRALEDDAHIGSEELFRFLLFSPSGSPLKKMSELAQILNYNFNLNAKGGLRQKLSDIMLYFDKYPDLWTQMDVADRHELGFGVLQLSSAEKLLDWMLSLRHQPFFPTELMTEVWSDYVFGPRAIKDNSKRSLVMEHLAQFGSTPQREMIARGWLWAVKRSGAGSAAAGELETLHPQMVQFSPLDLKVEIVSLRESR